MKNKVKIVSPVLFCFRILLIVLFIIPFNSCSSDLSRGQAAKRIKQLYPKIITKEFKLHQSVSSMWIILRNGRLPQNYQKEMEEIESLLNAMKKDGLIDFKKNQKRREVYLLSRMPNVSISYDIQPTKKLERFIRKRDKRVLQIEVAKVLFDKITGITKDGNVGRVAEYKTRTKANDVAKYFKLSDYEKNPQKHSVRFRKYDDGWRLVVSRY